MKATSMEARMNQRIILSLLALTLTACSTSGGGPTPQTNTPAIRTATSAQYTVVSLGTLGGASSGANSINNRNWASGLSSSTSSSYIHAALWENGSSPVDLGTLGGPNSAVEWPVKNDRGLIAGISETNEAQKLGETWSCAESFFPQPPSGHVCRGFAAGANDRGQIVGWAETRKQDSSCTPPQVLGFEAVIYQLAGKRKIQEL